MKDSKTKKKFRHRTLIMISVGLIAIAGAGTAGYFISDITKNNNNQKFHYKNSYGKNMSGGVKLINNPVDANTEGKDFFLSENDLNQLKAKIDSDLQYGPEFSDLVRISIDDKNIVDNDSTLGAFVPSMDVININTESWRESGLSTISKESPNDIEGKLKIDLIFQVIFHEYGHFLASEYLNAEPNTSLVTKIYSFQSVDEGEKAIYTHNNWDKNFYSQFQYLLNYNKPVNKNNAISVQNKIVSNSTKSVADIFQAVNANSISKLNNVDDIKNQDRYYYSMDELFTRKYQQIMMPLGGTFPIEWKPPLKNVEVSPYGVDYFKMKNDNPFKVSIALYELLGTQIGFTGHNNISHLSIEDGKLIIGGFTDEENPKLLASNKEINGVTITTHKLQMNLNEGEPLTNGAVSVNTNKKVIDKSKYFWVSSPIKISNVVNKPLTLFANKKSVPLDINNKITRTVSTYRPLWKNSENFHVVDEKGNVKIVLGSGA